MRASNLTPTAFVAAVPGAPQRAVIGDRLGTRYLLLQPLGKGAASRVFLARDERTNAHVAVKVIPPYGTTPFATRERLDAELAAGCGVVHANVARILDVGTSPWGEPFMVTEALAGETLGERLREQSRLSLGETLTTVREAARGLAAVHRAGYVHRDVKPDNLFLCDVLRHGVGVKVIDFGFCAAVTVGRASERPRTEENVLGTLEYIAPEQAVAESTDGRADVYALGVVLFRCLTGELPFDASGTEVLTHHLVSQVPPPSWLVDGLGERIDPLVLSATRKNPDNRYPTMDAFIEDLDRALLGAEPFGAPMRVEPDHYRPSSDRGRLALDTLSDAL